ncbi:MAG TPA: hypothetical protein VFY74_03395 [Methyloceanibacter sp.]|jgi:hypothetical protein|nr:hypothetical protein [Methyloceanibacter sp.]
MYAKVMRDQFHVQDESIVHAPTGAEFTPVAEESMVIWTGDIGRALPDGAVYCYAEVLAMMQRVWREMALAS